MTRWSSRITQSETYSSSPCRVSVPLAALAGDHRGDAAVLQPAEQPAQLGAQDAPGSGSPRTASRSCRAPPASRRSASMALREPDEQPFEVVLAGLLDLAALDVYVVDDELALASSIWSRSKPERGARWRPGPPAVSSNAMKTPGSSNCSAPRTRNSMANKRLAAAGAAADQRRAAARQAAAGDLVEALDAGRGLGQALAPRRRRPAGMTGAHPSRTARLTGAAPLRHGLHRLEGWDARPECNGGLREDASPTSPGPWATTARAPLAERAGRRRRHRGTAIYRRAS